MESKKINLLESDPFLPLPRIVNGFRITSEFVSETDKRVIFRILPNNLSSEFAFYFKSLWHAEFFAKGHCNRHSSQYWIKRVHLPIFLRHNVVKFL